MKTYPVRVKLTLSPDMARFKPFSPTITLLGTLIVDVPERYIVKAYADQTVDLTLDGLKEVYRQVLTMQAELYDELEEEESL